MLLCWVYFELCRSVCHSFVPLLEYIQYWSCCAFNFKWDLNLNVLTSINGVAYSLNHGFSIACISRPIHIRFLLPKKQYVTWMSHAAILIYPHKPLIRFRCVHSTHYFIQWNSPLCSDEGPPCTCPLCASDWSSCVPHSEGLQLSRDLGATYLELPSLNHVFVGRYFGSVVSSDATQSSKDLVLNKLLSSCDPWCWVCFSTQDPLQKKERITTSSCKHIVNFS